MSNGLPVCPTCLGSGQICGCQRGEVDPHSKDIGHTVLFARADGLPCPSCGGTGWLLSDELVRVGKLAAMNSGDFLVGMTPEISLTEHNNQKVRACLVAVFDHLKGEAE